MIRRTIPMVLMAIAVFALVACDGGDEAEQARQKIEEAAQATGEYLKQQQSEFKANLREGLNELDREAQQLTQQAEELSAEAKADFQARLESLEDERQALRGQMEALSEKSGDAWEQAKTETEQAWERLEAEYEQLARDVEQSGG